MGGKRHLGPALLFKIPPPPADRNSDGGFHRTTDGSDIAHGKKDGAGKVREWVMKGGKNVRGWKIDER